MEFITKIRDGMFYKGGVLGTGALCFFLCKKHYLPGYMENVSCSIASIGLVGVVMNVFKEKDDMKPRASALKNQHLYLLQNIGPEMPVMEGVLDETKAEGRLTNPWSGKEAPVNQKSDRKLEFEQHKSGVPVRWIKQERRKKEALLMSNIPSEETGEVELAEEAMETNYLPGAKIFDIDEKTRTECLKELSEILKELSKKAENGSSAEGPMGNKISSYDCGAQGMILEASSLLKDWFKDPIEAEKSLDEETTAKDIALQAQSAEKSLEETTARDVALQAQSAEKAE